MDDQLFPTTVGEGSAAAAAPPPPLPDVLVADLMATQLYALSCDETPLVAWELLERTGCHHLPVLRADGHCAGVLDRAELAVACAAPAIDLTRRRLGDLLTGKRAVTVTADTRVSAAAGLMHRNGRDAVPVVDGSARLVGLLTASDIVAAVAGYTRRAAGRDLHAGTAVPFLPGLPPRHRETQQPTP